MIVEGHARRDDVDHRQAVVRDAGLQDGRELPLVAGEGARHEGGAQLDGREAGIDRRQLVDDAGLQLRAHIGGGRELALGQAVDSVVLDDVDQRHVPAQHVHELADADGRRVAVAGDHDAVQGAVGEQSAGGDGGRAPVHGVEAVRLAQEVRRGLRRAADAGDLRDVPRFDAHLPERLDQALGDGVVAAARAQRRLAAVVADDLEPDAVDLLGRGRRGGAHNPSWRTISSVTVRASSGRPP